MAGFEDRGPGAKGHGGCSCWRKPGTESPRARHVRGPPEAWTPLPLRTSGPETRSRARGPSRATECAGTCPLAPELTCLCLCGHCRPARSSRPASCRCGQVSLLLCASAPRAAPVHALRRCLAVSAGPACHAGHLITCFMSPPPLGPMLHGGQGPWGGHCRPWGTREEAGRHRAHQHHTTRSSPCVCVRVRTRLPRCWFSGVSTPVWSWFSGVEPVCPGVAPPPRPPSTRSCFHRRSCRACGSSNGTLLGATLRASPARCFLAGPPQPPSAVSGVRARGSVRPPPFPAFTGHARPAARSLGGFRSVPRRSGARRGGQRAARATVPLYRGRPVLLQPTPLHTAPALRPLTARRPLQLPPTSQPRAHWGRLSWTTSGSGLAPGFSLPESPSVQSPACPRPCGAGRRMFPCVRRRCC